MTPYLIRRSIGLAGAVVVAVLLGACQPQSPSFNAVDITGTGYGASLPLLRDTNGKALSIADFKGKAVAVFFGFTQCPDVCPTTLAKLKDIKNRLGADADKLAVVLVTVDPERDKPELLRQYVRAFDPDFVALHGDLPATTAVASDFKVFFEKIGDVGAGNYMVNHTSGVYLFDPAGRIRLFARHDDTPEQILADVKLLLDNQ